MSLCKQETEGHPGLVLFFWSFCILQTGLLHSVPTWHGRSDKNLNLMNFVSYFAYWTGLLLSSLNLFHVTLSPPRILLPPHLVSWNASGFVIALKTKLQAGTASQTFLVCPLPTSPASSLLSVTYAQLKSPQITSHFLHFSYLLAYWPFPSWSLWLEHKLISSAFSPLSFKASHPFGFSLEILSLKGFGDHSRQEPLPSPASHPLFLWSQPYCTLTFSEAFCSSLNYVLNWVTSFPSPRQEDHQIISETRVYRQIYRLK